MAHLQPTMSLTVGSETIAAVNPDPALSAHLLSFGYNPSDFNYLHWPTGASRWAEGSLLVIGSDVAGDIAAELRNSDAILNLTSEVGTLSIKKMRLGPPTPILTTNRGSVGGGLYRLPIYCARRDAHTRPAAFSYNLTQDEGGGLTRDADAVLTDLLLIAGLPVSFTAPDDGWMPYDIRSQASPATAWADTVLRETGRVYVYGINGGGSVEYDDQRRAIDVLSELNDYIISGSALYASTGTTGHHVDVSPGLDWINHPVPRSVSVIFRNNGDGDPVIEAATYTATDAGFPDATGATVFLNDNAPIEDGENDPAERASALAESFYRRYKAGGMLARAVGWHGIELGGACRSVTWRLVNGVPLTDMDSNPFSEPPGANAGIGVTAGGGLSTLHRPGGGVDVVGSGGGSGAGLEPYIVVGSESIGEDLFDYLVVRAIIPENSTSVRDWEPDENMQPVKARNTTERVTFDGYSANPIATGTGVLVSSIGGNLHFSLSNVEGSCGSG